MSFIMKWRPSTVTKANALTPEEQLNALATGAETIETLFSESVVEESTCALSRSQKQRLVALSTTSKNTKVFSLAAVAR